MHTSSVRLGSASLQLCDECMRHMSAMYGNARSIVLQRDLIAGQGSYSRSLPRLVDQRTIFKPLNALSSAKSLCKRYGLCQGSRHRIRPQASVETEKDTGPLEGKTPPQQTGTVSSKPRRARRSRKPAEAEVKEAPSNQNTELPKRILTALALIAFSRVGVYIRLPGVDVDAFSQQMQGGGLLSYIDALSGGSVSRVGIFSLGIVPLINASIVLQLLTTTFPSLKKLQQEEGAQGRARFELYQRLVALVFAAAQAWGALLFVRPYVADFGGSWLLESMLTLIVGSVIMNHIASLLTELKLGNGTSILIAANIASALPASVGAAISQSAAKDSANLGIYGLAFLLTALGVVFVQEAERRIPMNYATRYENSAISNQAYLPFKVNATGVMPVIFATTLLSLPQAAARYIPALSPVAGLLAPNSVLYLPTNVLLIVLFNYAYTFQQLDPKEMAEQLKRQGSSVQGIRPGKKTASFIAETLNRMSLLGSGFLGLLAAAPAGVEALTKLQAFRGFAGTSVLIMVGVATDTTRRLRAEKAMTQYGDMDRFYKSGVSTDDIEN